MKILLTAFALIALTTGCDLVKMPEKMDKMKDLTAGMSDKMDGTNENIRLQKLLLTTAEFSKSENFDKLFPIPTGILVPAQKFAESATVDELVKFTYLQLQYVDKITPADRVDINGNKLALTAPEQWNFTLQKATMLQALKAVAGFIPDQVVQQMVDAEIKGRGRFQNTALQILAMRSDFISNVLLGQSALDTEEAGFETIGRAKEAVRYQEQVEYILDLPFRKYIMVQTNGITPPANYKGDVGNYKFDLSDAKNVKILAGRWKDIRQKSEYASQVTRRDWTGNISQDDGIRSADVAAFQKIAEKAKAKEQEWKTKLGVE